MTLITEAAFQERIEEALADRHGKFAWVMGPGRSGAIAAIYASHILNIPWVPYGFLPRAKGKGLLIDIAHTNALCLNRAVRRYRTRETETLLLFHTPDAIPVLWFQCPAISVKIFKREKEEA